MRARPTAQRAGFTLIEVMVAVAILALAFTAIFSSEGGAIKVAQRARQIETAVSLVRCKMGEIDEKLLNEGLPAIEAHDTDGCCEDAERPGFECEWHIDRVVLPDVPVKSDEEAGEDAAAAGAGAGAGAETTGGTKAKSGGTKTEATDTLAEVQKTLSASTAGGAGTDSLDQALAGVDMGGLSDLAFDLAFPIIKPAIEAAACSAVRVTLAGSRMPISSMSP